MSQSSHARFPLRRHPHLHVDHRRVRTPSLLICEELAPSRDQIGAVADIRSVRVAGLNRSSQGAAGMGLSTASVLRNRRRHLRRSRLYFATLTAPAGFDRDAPDFQENRQWPIWTTTPCSRACARSSLPLWSATSSTRWVIGGSSCRRRSPPCEPT